MWCLFLFCDQIAIIEGKKKRKQYTQQQVVFFLYFSGFWEGKKKIQFSYIYGLVGC